MGTTKSDLLPVLSIKFYWHTATATCLQIVSGSFYTILEELSSWNICTELNIFTVWPFTGNICLTPGLKWFFLASFFFLILLGVWLIYSVVLVSGVKWLLFLLWNYKCFTMLLVSAVQQWISCVCVCVYPLPLEPPSHTTHATPLGHPRAPS